jgi:DNA-binding NarL/FixJ family response regulator
MSAVSERFRIAHVDPDPVARRGFASMLAAPSYETVLSTDEIDAGLDALSGGEVDLLVSESRFPRKSVFAAIDKRGVDFQTGRVVIFSDEADEATSSLAARALAYGVAEVIPKTLAPAEVEDALRRVMLGLPSSHASLLNGPRQLFFGPRRRGPQPDPTLTWRETQTLESLALGLSNREIARLFGVSVETVKEHVQNVLRKLGLKDRTHAAVWALKRVTNGTQHIAV